MQSRSREKQDDEDDGSGQRRIIVKEFEVGYVVGHTDSIRTVEKWYAEFHWTFAGALVDHIAGQRSIAVGETCEWCAGVVSEERRRIGEHISCLLLLPVYLPPKSRQEFYLSAKAAKASGTRTLSHFRSRRDEATGRCFVNH